MIKHSFLPRLLFFLAILISVSTDAQDYARLKENADTLNFSVPITGDWQLLNSYVGSNKAADSVALDLVVLNDKAAIDWENEQYIGRIKAIAFLPKEEQVGVCRLIDDEYTLRVATDGKCYLSLKSINPPRQVPLILPLNIMYKL